ncbi:MAG TPA: hypothetical protein PLP61_11740, partial [Nocardioides sp.]|nr:hypothetical protein [Nocardioides sp.]
RAIAPTVLGRPVHVPRPGEYVARGAARQAAWALTGSLPDWPLPGTQVHDSPVVASVRERYREATARGTLRRPVTNGS